MLPQIPSVKQWRFMMPGQSGRIQGSSLKPLPADPVVCFPCRLHICASLKYSPTWAHIGSSSVETYCPSGIIYFYVFTFVNSFLHSFHKISVVTSMYKKQQTVFHCDLNTFYSECGTNSVLELQKIDSLTISVCREYT